MSNFSKAIKDNRDILILFAASRLFFALMILISQHSYSEVIGLFDAEHYRNIAEYGYYHRSMMAFFPMIPLLIKYTGDIGVLIINEVCFLSSLFVLKDLITKDYRCRDPRPVLLILAVSPVSFFSMLEYTESLFFFLTLMSFLLFKRRKYPWLMGILMGLSVTTRNAGALLFFAIFAGMCIDWARKETRFRDIIAAYIPATLLSLSFPVYLQIKFGDWKIFLDSQYDYWLKIHSNVFKTVYWNLRYVFTDNFPYDAADTKILFKINEGFTLIIFGFIIFLCIREAIPLIKYKKILTDSVVLILFSAACVISFSSTIRDPLIDCPTDSFFRYYLGMFSIYAMLGKRPLQENASKGVIFVMLVISIVTSAFFSMGVFFF